MRILIAEDDGVSRRVLQGTLTRWGYEVVAAPDGSRAWELLQAEDAPPLAVLDWNMPGMDGLEICRRMREVKHRQATYLVLLTGRGSREDMIAGLDGGADDYVLKPFDPEELHARLRAGQRIVELQHSLADRIRELESALRTVQQLEGLLPICMYCKKIRDDQNYWQQVEHYLAGHSRARFSHGICPACFESIVEPELKRIKPRVTAAPRTSSRGQGGTGRKSSHEGAKK